MALRVVRVEQATLDAAVDRFYMHLAEALRSGVHPDAVAERTGLGWPDFLGGAAPLLRGRWILTSGRGKPFHSSHALYGRVPVVSVDRRLGEEGLEAVFRRETPRLWRALMAYTAGRTVVAEDAMAEAFTRALAHSESIRDPVAWLYRVSFRLAAEEMRRERRADPADVPVDVAESAVESELLEPLFYALQRLPPNQRAAVFLHYQCDLSVAEVAARLGIARATVRVHLWRGREQLRRLLEEDGDE